LPEDSTVMQKIANWQFGCALMLKLVLDLILHRINVMRAPEICSYHLPIQWWWEYF